MLASHTSYEQSAAAEASEKASLLNGMVGIDAPHLTILAVCACWGLTGVISSICVNAVITFVCTNLVFANCGTSSNVDPGPDVSLS